MPRHDWLAVREAYVEGFLLESGVRHYPTCEELSEKFGISSRMISGRCFRDGWANNRVTFIQKIENTRQDAIAGKLANRAIAFDTRCLREAERLLDSCVKVHTHLFAEKRIPAALELARLVNAFRLAQAIGRTALGISANDELVDAMPVADGTNNLVEATRVRVTYERARIQTARVLNDDEGDPRSITSENGSDP